MKKFLSTLLILLTLMLTGCGKEDSAENALAEMQVALAERNSEKLAERIDLEKFFAQTYDDVTVELVKNCAEYGKKYPTDPEENPHAYVANEFEKILQASTAAVKDTKVEGNHATLTVEMQGDDSIRGKFIGNIIFKIGFDKDANDKWHFTQIENLDEVVPTLVDKAEMIWITFF